MILNAIYAQNKLRIKLPITRAGWKVTKIYSHYNFELERFKKKFILMSQKSRQKATNSVEKDFS